MSHLFDSIWFNCSNIVDVSAIGTSRYSLVIIVIIACRIQNNLFRWFCTERVFVAAKGSCADQTCTCKVSIVHSFTSGANTFRAVHEPPNSNNVCFAFTIHYCYYFCVCAKRSKTSKGHFLLIKCDQHRDHRPEILIKIKFEPVFLDGRVSFVCFSLAPSAYAN